MTDRFYTSPELADTLLSFAARKKPELVADFACGEGSLLMAAERLWPEARLIANDISRGTLMVLRKEKPGWHFSCADFLNPASVRASAVPNYLGKIDLIAINPPFSRRGRKTYAAQLLDVSFKSSIATAFVLNCLPYLSDAGVLLAVLPDGCLVSTHDSQIWVELQRFYKVEVIRDNSRSAFARVRARTCLVRITKLAVQNDSLPSESDLRPLVKLTRGACQMHSRKRSKAIDAGWLVHTTNLRSGAVTDSREKVKGRCLEGPALLFPRVGLVTPDKVCVLESGRRVVLSDCVIGVACSLNIDAFGLQRTVIEAWPEFAAGFRGTGAPYITLERASRILSRILAKSAFSMPIIIEEPA